MTTLTTDAAPQSAAPAKGSNKSRPRTPAEWILMILACLGALIVVFPMVLLLINAFKSPADYANSSPLDLPKALDFTGIKTFWETQNFPRALWNSIFISTMVAVLGVILSVLNSFAIGIGRVRGRTWIVLAFLMANLIPQEMLFDPLFKLYDKLGLLSNPWSVIITFTVIQAAFGTYLLSSLLGTFPKEILEAAAVDGASRGKILRSVIVPIIRPTLSVLMVFFFIWTWNEFLLPLAFLNTSDSLTVPLLLEQLNGERQTDTTTLIAGTLISIIPTMIFFLIFQRTLTRGITAGAVK
ncbi:carbohydrate ABC transporter permease [Demequina capsici]|uniref:Carbohydrate ABC transporter permease n=1 Tax=Demequina capsici TaxID=3075620 RepID=A0AA96FCJ9_9MICO|nr:MULTISPECIES: carbohydrate ABC transporter permease [unclassified Demequina]WNM24739.1 carbohydrate ABC transporter permease [Demequina sp. OYTSA14]WNM27648.1 carbohydrate ABC transporter permease [Demequina sp. PMTSA13]